MRKPRPDDPAIDAQPVAGVLDWLVTGDPAIGWQTERDLLGRPRSRYEATRRQVAATGWGARLLEQRTADGRWGGGLYTPKWTSTFYTLQLLSVLGVGGEQPEAAASCRLLLEAGVQVSGGVRLWDGANEDTCVTGMLLAMAVRFGHHGEPRAARMLRWLLQEQMGDGGWNCRRHRTGTTHSSFHTTTSVLEALDAWLASGEHDPRVSRAAAAGRELMLAHHLYRSHRTGTVVRSDFTRFTFPHWWKFDVLRGLDAFRAAEAPWDPRLADPVELVASRRRPDGRWELGRPHPGKVWFALEPPGQPSRWNTLRALRVLRWAERAHPGPDGLRARGAGVEANRRAGLDRQRDHRQAAAHGRHDVHAGATLDSHRDPVRDGQVGDDARA